MNISLLFYGLTGAGLVGLFWALAVYAFGKKRRGKQDEPERIKLGNRVDLKTSSVFSVILLTAVLAALPLVLIYMKPDLVKDIDLNVHGQAMLDGDRFAENVEIEVVRTSEDNVDTLRFHTDEQGQFLIKIPHAKPDEEYRISWIKAGYATENRSFYFSTYPCAIRLSRGGDN